LTEPVFSLEFKYKTNGLIEDVNDVANRYNSFIKLHSELPHKLAIMVKHGNKFYIPNKYDSRLRCYPKANHFNFMGTKYLKAMLQFNTKEIIDGNFN